MKTWAKNHLLIWGLGWIVSSCQSNQPTSAHTAGQKLGLNPTPKSSLSQIRTADRRVFSAIMPRSFSLTMPPVEPNGQGNESSCVAWAAAYTTLSFYHNNWNQSTTGVNYNVVFSPEYVYNQTRLSADCTSGAYFVSVDSHTGVLDLLKGQGVCTWQEMPYTDTDCSTQPNSQQQSLASQVKISGYGQITGFSTDDLKKLLLTQSPIIIGAMVDEGFVNATRSFVWNSANGSSLGGHAMVIVGYDDGKQAFKIQNSWGNGWGDAGYGWLAYSYYDKVVFEGYVLYLN